MLTLLLSAPCKELPQSRTNWGAQRVNAPLGPCWGLGAAGGSTGRGTIPVVGRDCP